MGRVNSTANFVRANKSGQATVLLAGRDLAINAAEVINTCNGPTRLVAGHNLTVGSLTETRQLAIGFDSQNHLNAASSADIGSRIQTPGDLTLMAGQDITVQAADMAALCSATLNAGHDLKSD